MKEIYIEYIDANEKYIKIERDRDYFINELNILSAIDGDFINDVKMIICALTSKMFKVRAIYTEKENILNENIYDGEDYAYAMVESYTWLNKIDEIRESRAIKSKKWWRI